MNVDFNEYVEDYQRQIHKSQSFAGADHDFYLRVKAAALIETTKRRIGDIRGKNVLDVGCGIGLMEPHLVGSFGGVTGVDIAEQAVDYARKHVPGARFRVYDGRVLPFPDEAFDIVFACCVMHHVAFPQWPAFVKEMNRVLTPGGLAVVFEHNPVNPATRLAVARCEFDRDAVLLGSRTTTRLFRGAGFDDLLRQYILFFPWEGRIWSAAERMLRWLPMGAQYFVAGSKVSQVPAAGPLKRSTASAA
jgi:ubiquinone/menaquinone biosynthesis C-methylase UbiE